MPRLRRALDPFLASYYAVPFFAFYPVFIVLFGLGAVPIIAIGLLFGVVAMIIATLTGLDRMPRVLAKTARIYRMGPSRPRCGIKLPSAAPYLFTGVKLAVAYSFIGVIAAEFILAPVGARLFDCLCVQQFRQPHDVCADAVRHCAGHARQCAVPRI